MWKEFKEFAVRGNVTDMVVGILVGAAFATVVNSLVYDIMMPPIGMVIGKVNLANYFLNLSGGDYATLEEAKAAGAVTVNYGLFLNKMISFFIVAFCVFILVRQVNRLKRQEDVASIAPTQKSCPFCLQSISIKAVRCPYCTSHLAELENAS